MTTPEEPATIVIAGGGIVGLTLAMALKKQLGVVPEIYEKTGTFATEAGAGLGMYPNGLRVLRDISPELLHAVREAGYPYKSRAWERHDGTEIMSAEESILSDGESELESIGIRRSSLQKVLYAHALSQGISIQFRKPLHSAVEREEDNLIHIQFADGTSRLTKVLFGADGALGKSRSIVAGTDNPKLEYTGVTCLMGLANCQREGIAFPSSNKDDFHAVFFPTGPNEQCFQFHIPVPEEEANQLNWGNLSDEVGKEECCKMANQLRSEGWHDKYIEPLNNVIRAVRVGFALLEPRLKSWVKGHIALVGDAAHPPVPYVGQGAQQGLEDAGVIVSLLKVYCLDAHGCFDPTNFENAMKVYQEIRIPRSSKILDFSKSLGIMQASRAGEGGGAIIADELLRGEVLMYGTLPAIVPGAGHDYKDDVLRATQENDLPTVTTEAAMEALEYILGTDQPTSSMLSSLVAETEVTTTYAVSPQRTTQLVEWLVNTLHFLLKQIVVHRKASEDITESTARPSISAEDISDYSWSSSERTVVDEVCEAIELPEVFPCAIVTENDPASKSLPHKVVTQLRGFVTSVASLYRNNPFHNFEHACHVTMSVYKLLTRMTNEPKGPTLTVQDKTYCLISDPITTFACVFSALIHDADHEGVPNTQLMKEHADMAQMYKGKCIAECHSVDVAWGMLMDPQYKDLRDTIYTNDKEFHRFRQLVVNMVVATDICDKDMMAFRNSRWKKAFPEPVKDTPSSKSNKNLRATIEIEHLIQVSDVSHTIQPWHVYRQWNQRLYEEMYKAYKEGRASKDPAEFWYKGEVGFFDFYVIPLAKKLKKCEIFGSSFCEECLANALNNREQWLQKGEKIVEEMIEKVHNQWDVQTR